MKVTGKRKRPHRHHFTDLGIDVFESRHSEDFTMDMDEWDFHKLCAIAKGNGFVETESAMVPISANQLIYLPAHVPHRFLDKRGDPLTRQIEAVLAGKDARTLAREILEEAGYISCTKYFEGRLPKTEYKLTAAGRSALENYISHMESLIKQMRNT